MQWILQHPAIDLLDNTHLWVVDNNNCAILDQHVIVYREFLQAVMSFWTSLACPTKEYFEELLAIGCTIENGMMRCAAQYPTIRAQTFG